MCELGRIDILHETNLLSQYMVAPRMGPLLQVLNEFKYIKTHDRRSWLVFDPIRYDVIWIPFGDETRPETRVVAMQEMYVISSGREMPKNMPEEAFLLISTYMLTQIIPGIKLQDDLTQELLYFLI